MADVSARFRADFTPFANALKSALVELKTFEDGASTVNKNLTKLGNDFSGVKVIQQAALMQKAVELAGGAANLTDKELQKVSASAAAAGEKMAALGIKTEASEKFLAGFQQTSTQTADSFRGLYTNVTKSTEASDAFRASFSGVAKETQQAVTATTSVASVIEQLGAKFGISTQAITPFLGSLGEMSIAMAGLIAGAAAVGVAIYKLGSQAAEAGDQINDLALKFDISGSRASVLDAAVKIAGGSTEQLANAVFLMSKNLEGTDAAAEHARAALKRMGIDAEAFVQLDMDQKIYAINEAYRATRPSADDLSAIFGRQAKELIPLLSKNLTEAADRARALGAQMDDAMVKKADEAAQSGRELSVAWQSLTRNLGVVALPVLEGVNTKIETAIFSLRWYAAAIRGAADAWGYFAAKVAASTESAEGTIRNFNARLKETLAGREATGGPGLDEAFKIAGDAIEADTKKAAEFSAAQKKAADDGRRVADQAVAAWDKMTAAVSGTNSAFEHQIQLTDTLAAKLPQLEGRLLGSGMAAGGPGSVNVTGGTTYGTGLGQGPAKFAGTTPETTTIVSKLKTQLTGVAGSLNDIFQSAFEGGGGALGAIKSFATKAIAAVSSLIPVVGPVISKFAGAIVAGFSKIFSKSEETLKVSPIRDEFFKMAGGLEVLNPKVQALTGNLTAVQAVFDAKTVDQYNAALTNLNAILGLQDTAMADLTATAQKYGFTLEELGPALQRQNLDAQAQQLYKDFQLLTSGGVDTVAVLTRMSGATNDYVQNAIAMGIEVPEAMRPMLEAMAKQGVLTDASGKKIENLEDAGISFALSMSEGFKALISSVEKLTNAISVGLGLAIRNIPEPTITVHTRIDTSGLQEAAANAAAGIDVGGGAMGGLVTSAGIQAFAGGGRVLAFRPRGTDTVPAMLTPGETVRTKAQESELTSLLLDIRNQGRRAPEALAIAVRDALLQSGRR